MYSGFEYGGGGGNFGGFEMDGGHGDSGGGFMDSGSKSAEKKSRDRQTLIPATVKQLLSSVNDGESFKIDDVELFTVKIIGFIESIQPHSTHVIYTINDGSGTIECKEWIEKGSASSYNFSVNAHVRVFGNLREYEGRKHILTFNIQVLEDWNELTTHMLDVVYTHLQLSRGPIPGSSSVAGQLNPMTPHRMAMSASSNMSIAAPSGGMYNGYAPVQMKQENNAELICDVVRSISNPEGAHIEEVMRGLKQRNCHMNIMELKKFLSMCIDQGTMYSGADDDHICII